MSHLHVNRTSWASVFYDYVLKSAKASSFCCSVLLQMRLVYGGSSQDVSWNAMFGASESST